MVNWLSPSQLADTGLKAVIAATFGSYADKREVEVAVSPIDDAQSAQLFFDYSEKQELWFDYVADLGDGFNPTYAIAYLLAKEQLAVDGHATERGRFLVLGGDQVYPTANRSEYLKKLIGPYRAALPWTNDPPDIFAIPGNHDWYDGLTSFLRIFCQSRDETGTRARWVGGWRARQRRSYFAIRLPNNWWVWGIDAQLASDLDQPQLAYFDDLGDWMVNEGGEHKIILVAPEPNWVYCGGDDDAKKTRALNDPLRFDTLAHFEAQYIRAKNGLRLSTTIAGDLHHYCRYTNLANGTYRITSGGGGAYLYPSHQMPERISIPEPLPQTYTRTVPMPAPMPGAEPREALYPPAGTSRILGLRIRAIPLRNKSFGLMLGFIYLMFAWLLQSASDSAFIAKLADGLTLDDARGGIMRVLAHSPGTAFFMLAIVGGVAAYSYTERKHSAILPWTGALHGVLHVLLAFVLMWCGAHAVNWILGARAATLHVAAFLIAVLTMLIGGWFAGSLLFGAYIWLMSVTTGGHTNDVYSSMAIQDYKHFLRFHVKDDGSIEIFAIGIDNVPREWTLDPERGCTAPFFEPKGTKLEPRVVDGPFTAA
jgi:hypothetical protein